jgi:PAS domain S-box-containing protein
MASVLLLPYASFIMAGLSSLIIYVIGLNVLRWPNVPAMLGFFAVALVAWLSSRSLERALEELRITNRELDRRVVERTRDLAKALSRNQAILAGIADGVIVFDHDGQATVANPAMGRLLGQPFEEIVGRDIDTLMGGNVDADDQEVISSLLKDQVQSYPGLKLQWGNKTLSVSFAPVQDNLGQTAGTVAVFRDFTREAELERMKSVFVSTVSHELRTPLNAILGYADMLKEAVYGTLSDKQLGAIERIMANSKRQLSIVNDLLDQAQIEAGKITLKVTPFNLAELVDDVQGVMGVLTQAKGLELTRHITTDVPAMVPGDQQRLHQILVNLVGNAIKFTEEGEIQVRVYRPNPAHWALEVSDTGCGIPPEAQPYIFDPFRQVDDSITREHTGSGLGLSIVKQLTTLMGGEITLASKVGHGSTFTIVLPLVPTQEESL